MFLFAAGACLGVIRAAAHRPSVKGRWCFASHTLAEWLLSVEAPGRSLALSVLYYIGTLIDVSGHW